MIDKIKEIAVQAGHFLKENQGRISEVKEKGSSTNLVTDIDRKSEAMIVDFVRKNFPGHDVLAEEGGGSKTNSEYKWIVDPLDGTTNFTHGYPVYCVSIAVEHKGEVIAGAVYDPNLDEMFTSEKGSGAFLNGERIHVSQTDNLPHAMLATGFPYDVKDDPYNCIEHFDTFLLYSQAIRRLGSAALDICNVANGRLDGFWEVNLHAWDTAAAVLISTEAGGRVSDFRGGKYSIYDKNILLSNGRIHDAMIKVLAKNLK
ncbi:MAG TPA: inositol monophosphatase family protein [Candidatus Kryptonia bacterium]